MIVLLVLSLWADRLVHYADVILTVALGDPTSAGARIGGCAFWAYFFEYHWWPFKKKGPTTDAR